QATIDDPDATRVQAISPDGMILVTFGIRQWHEPHYFVKLWDTRTGRLRTTLRITERSFTSASFDHSGSSLAILFEGPDDPHVRVWDVTTGLERNERMGASIRMPAGPLRPNDLISPMYLADGRTLVLREYGRKDDFLHITTTAIWDLRGTAPRKLGTFDEG